MANVQIVISYKDGSASARQQTAAGLKGIGDAAKNAKGDLNAFGQVAVGALRRVGEFSVNALGQAVQAVGTFAVSSINAAGDYEQSMNVFQVQSEATAAEMDAVKAKAKELGADLTLPATSAAEAGTAMLELSKAGLSVQASMDAAKGTLQLAAAAQIDEATAASITANALNTFHLAGSEAVRVADMLAAGANASSASITDLAQGLQQGGFAFAAAGQGIDDLVASVGILTNVGLTGSDSGTALKNAIMRLMNPTQEASALMRQLGINVYDAQGKMLPMRDIIGMLNDRMAGMTQAERNSALATIFLSDGMKAMIPLMDAGVEGFDKMKGAVNRQGAAAELAAAQMTGLKGATEGLGSQIETLALEALEPLLPIMTSVVMSAAEVAGSFVGKVGPAVQDSIAIFTAMGESIQTYGIPALTGLAGALLTYALVSIPAALPAISAAIIAFEAQAVAVAATMAPYALIALAIGGVVLAYQDFQSKVQTATQSLLESRQWWTDSAVAITSYGQATGEAATKLEPYANTIKAIREQIRGELEDLGRRDAAGLVSEAARAAEMATINTHVAALQTATAAYNEQESALLHQQAASLTATARTAELEAGTAQIAQQAALTADELAKLAKQIEETFQRGTQAVGAYVETEIGFLSDLEQSHATSDKKITTEQALAYAERQAAQSAHLGQMLADYTATQVAMGNITSEAGQKIIGEIENRFGVMEDSSAKAFLAMTGHIDSFAASGSSDVNALGATLQQTADDAVATEQKMTALAKEYTATLVNNFNEGKMSAQELAAELRAIPSRVSSEVTITERRYYEEYRRGEREGRAAGGPVTAGTPYIVGERGPELFVPGASGSIVPNNQLPMTSSTTYVLNYTAVGTSAPADDVRQALRIQAMLQGY